MSFHLPGLAKRINWDFSRASSRHVVDHELSVLEARDSETVRENCFSGRPQKVRARSDKPFLTAEV